MKTVVVLQSNYIPWKGYFDLIHDADLFVFYDDVQYTKNDWRNRNRIKSQRGLEWITVPIGSSKGRLISEVEIKDPRWQDKHWRTLLHNYGKSQYFNLYKSFFEAIYLRRRWNNLSDLNQHIVRSVSADLLGIEAEFQDSREYALSGHKSERLLDLLIKAGADRYVSGPAAKNYIEPADLSAAGIELVWKDYSGYPIYEQRHPPFEHGVSIVDLLFNVGPQAPWFVWGWRKDQR